MLEQVTQIVLAAIGSTGLVLLIGKFALKKIVDKGIDHFLAERLEETKAIYAERLAAVTSNLRSDADNRLAVLTSELKSRADSKLEEERARYATNLESLKASLQSDANKDLERIRSSYVIEQEVKKAELSDTGEMRKILREKYSPFEELAYRIRNEARDSLKGTQPNSPQALKSLVTNFTEMMYQQIAYLDSDNLHLTVHRFKNTALAVSAHLADRAMFVEQNKQAEATAAAETLYVRLDEQYSQIKEAFRPFISGKTPVSGATS